MPAAWITDWQARLRGRLAMQYRESNHVGIVDAIAAQTQAVEDAGQALCRIYYIDPVTDDATSPLYGVGRGAQLDGIGAIVGQPNAGESDEIYRLYLRARIRANKSSGSPPNLFAVYQAMFAGAASMTFVPGGNATFALRIDSPVLTGAEVTVALVFLGVAKAAGVRGILEWTTADADHSFACDDASDLASTPGLGFGDSSTASSTLSAGGSLAGALQAS